MDAGVALRHDGSTWNRGGEFDPSMSALALRFVRWIAAISIAVTLAGICLAVYLEYRDDLRGIRDQVDSVETFVPTLSTSVWRLDDSQIDIQLTSIVQLPAIQRATIMIDGQPAYTQPAGAAAVVEQSADAWFPLDYEADGIRHHLGVLVVTADRSYATARIPVRFVEIATIQGVRGLLVAAMFFWVFSHLVGRRIRALSQDIGALNWDNLHSRPIPLEHGVRDELADVRLTLETMRTKIVEGMQREKDAQAELEFRRLFDPVTGLPNRTLLTDRLQTLLRSDANASLVVVAIELLRLSEIDYMLDSATMHQALRDVATALGRRTAGGGLLSRYSDRRFVVVVNHPDADALVAEIAAIFDEPFVAESGRSVYFSAAFGVALPAEDVDAAQLLSRAILALDSAISRGDGARAQWGEHLQQGVASIYQELRTALRQGAFDLHCQPIFDLESRRVISLECLLRWRLPRLAAYGTQSSIHLLERSGLSGLLDRAVLDAALAMRQRLADLYQGAMAINLTAHSLSDPTYADYVRSQRRQHLAGLELELTETNVLPDLPTAQSLADQCRELGIHLVLDDFGTGFSSIEYLSQFQFHCIKIDRSFLRPGLKNQERLLQSMVSIAHGVGSRVVAEGVEAQWQLDLAQRLDVDSVQGFLLGKPMPERELRDFLAAHRCQA